MSFEPSDFKEPATSTLARKIAAVMIPVVAAVPVTIAVVQNSKSNVPSAPEMNAMLGAEVQEETPSVISNDPDIPLDTPENEVPPGPTNLADTETPSEDLAPQTDDAATEDSASKSDSEEEPPMDLADTSLPAPPATDPIAEVVETPAEHTVQPGETLYGIGQKYGLEADELAQANGIPIDKPIIPGQSLGIPKEGLLAVSGRKPFTRDDTVTPPSGPVAMDRSGTDEGYSPPAAPRYIPPSIPAENLPVDKTTQENGRLSWDKSNRTPATAKYCIAYVVHRGDTLESIAFSHSTTGEIIKGMNHSTVITPGQVIMIPVDGIMTPCQ
tara:strand:+ start:12820 stop:13800 length:981 start_codon:yes stop_codon:yes gene_type:complete